MSTELEIRVTNLENQIKFMVTNSRLENASHNFFQTQRMFGSEIVTMNTEQTPPDVIPEFNYNTLDEFGMGFRECDTQGGEFISLSENGKYQLSNGDDYLRYSMDYGNSWVDVTEISNPYYGSLSYNGSVAMCITDAGLHISRDKFFTWILANVTVSTSSITAMSSNGNIMYVTNASMLYISEDYGVHWKKVNDFPNVIVNICVDCSGKNVTVLQTNTVVVSQDYGDNFKHVLDLNGRSIACSTTGQYQTIVTFDNHIHNSIDFGMTWITELFSPVISFQLLNRVSMSGSGQYQVIGGEYLYYSTDYGINWYTNDQLFPQVGFSPNPQIPSLFQVGISKDARCITIVNNSNKYSTLIEQHSIRVQGSNFFEPLDYSTFGNTWTQLSNYEDLSTAITGNDVNGAISKYGKYQTLAVQNNGIWVSSDYGVTYTQNQTANINWYGATMTTDGKTQIVIVSNGNLWRSDDYGSIWSEVTGTTDIWNNISMSANGKYIYVIGYLCGIYSDDYGVTWNNWISAQPYSKVVTSTSGKYVVVTYSNHYVVSNTYGLTWQNAVSVGNSIRDISISDDGANIVIAATANVYYSNDYGLTFTQASIELNSSQPHSVAMNWSGKYGFLITGINVFQTSNYGANWTISASSIAYKDLFLSKSGQYATVMNDTQISTSKTNDDPLTPGQFRVETLLPVSMSATVNVTADTTDTVYYTAVNDKYFLVNTDNLDSEANVSYVLSNYGSIPV